MLTILIQCTPKRLQYASSLHSTNPNNFVKFPNAQTVAMQSLKHCPLLITEVFYIHMLHIAKFHIFTLLETDQKL
jgi:hypothetical protein